MSTAPIRAKGSLGALNDTVAVELRDRAGVQFVLSGTFALTAIAEVSSDDGSTYDTTEIIDRGPETIMANTTATGTYAVVIPAGATHVRIKASAYTSGTATVQITATMASLVVYTRDPKPSVWAAKRKTVTAAGTAENLADTVVGANQKLTVRALSGNTGDAFLGISQAAAQTATTRTSLPPGEAVTINIDNANRVWVDVTTSGNGVDYHVG